MIIQIDKVKPIVSIIRSKKIIKGILIILMKAPKIILNFNKKIIYMGALINYNKINLIKDYQFEHHKNKNKNPYLNLFKLKV